MGLDDGSESRGEEKVGNITRVCPRGQQPTPRSLAAGPASTTPVSKALITVSVVLISPSSPPASFTRPRSRKIRISRVRAGSPCRPASLAALNAAETCCGAKVASHFVPTPPCSALPPSLLLHVWARTRAGVRNKDDVSVRLEALTSLL